MITMTANTYQQDWRALLHKNHEGYKELLGLDPFRDWSTGIGHQGAVREDARYGFEILFGDRNCPEGRRFLEQALEIGKRVVAEKQLESEQNQGSFPFNRATLLRSMAAAKGLLEGITDLEAFSQASTDMEAYWKDSAKKSWDSQMQSYYLSAARLALLGNDTEHAIRLLKVRKSFKWHPQQHEILLKLSNGPQSPLPLQNKELLVAFEEYFDLVRDPKKKWDIFVEPEWTRIELGALRDKYFISPNGTIDWQRVIEAVSR